MHLPEENDSKIGCFFFYFIKTKIKDIARIWTVVYSLNYLSIKRESHS